MQAPLLLTSTKTKAFNISESFNIIKTGDDYKGNDSIAWDNYCLMEESFVSSSDFEIYFDYLNISDNTVIIGIDSVNSNKVFASYDFAVYLSQSTGEVRCMLNGSLSSILGTLSIGDRIKLYRSSNSIKLAYSSDKINYTDLATIGSSSNELFVNLNLNNNLTIVNNLRYHK